MINEVSNYSKERILNGEILKCIYTIEDPIVRAHYVARITDRAKELRIKGEFDKLLKAYNSEQIKMEKKYKQRERWLQSDDCPLHLETNKSGEPLGSINNLLIILRSDPTFDNIRFNLLTNAPEKIVDGKAERWTDTDDSVTKAYIEDKCKIRNFKYIDDALRIFFKEHEYHPVKLICRSNRINTADLSTDV